MQYNSNADSQDIVSLIGDLTNTDTTQYPLKAITRAVNKWNKQVWAWIWEAYGGWKYQDSNDSGEPYADVNSVSGVSKIAIPTAATSITGFAYLDTASSEYRPLRPITLEQIEQRGFTLNNFMDTPSTPLYYLPLGNFIYVFPALNASVTSGYRVYLDRASSAFASTDTTKTPGFVSEFHEVLAVGAAFEFAKRKGLSNKNDLAVDLQGYEKRIKDYFSSRYAEMFPPRITVRDNTREFM